MAKKKDECSCQNPDNPFDFIGKLHREVLIYIINNCCPDVNFEELNECISYFICPQQEEIKKKIKKVEQNIKNKNGKEECILAKEEAQFYTHIYTLVNSVDEIGFKSFITSIIKIEDKIYKSTISTKQKLNLLGASSIARHTVSGGLSLALCCRACWLVHDALDIHYLDWMCCLGKCWKWGPETR
ncbi:MAG: hypothetical protein R6V32_04510 [Bacteroidales bacterium]